MKQLLLSAILGLAAVTLTPALSQAGTFGLFTNCGCCCCSKCTFCVRPYNAFTPVCCGNVTCMGCMPFAAPYPNYSGIGCEGPSCGPEGCDGGSPYAEAGIPEVVGQTSPLPQLAPQYAQPTTPQPQPSAPVVPPAPVPTTRAPSPYGTIQAGYYPAYAPTYNPYRYYNFNYYAPQGATPYYWNAK